ncbi:RND family transporter [Mycobacterium riyadhense]|uniref:MMPL/RND family transporter n=1 Tax=Mycobacterium riyadhense TaxID=486698 RepID=UPI00195B0B14|nr:RND family transporter [Mycobacterium riyadhense]
MANAFTALARYSHRYALWVIVAWVLVAGVANTFVPQLERVVAARERPLLPADAASSLAVQRSAVALSQKATDNIGYVVLQRGAPLNDRDRKFYDQLIAALRSDSRHVSEVMDWWGTPATSESAVSNDHNVAIAVVRPSGMIGTSQARQSITAMRGIVARLNPPDGLHIYVTGPGATVVDEFGAIDRQTLTITTATAVALLVLLLIVYRSLVTAMVPLVSVGLALAVARPILAILGDHNLIEVSPLSIALGAGVILGAGTDFGIFLLGRYHERRRQHVAPAEALADAHRGVAPVIVGSALTVATAFGCLAFARISIFRTNGIACAVGVLTAMLAALTLTPALIAVAERRGLLKPQRPAIARRWRRIGVAVARWPGPILVTSGALILALAIPLCGLHIGWDETASTPADAESNRGYQAVDRHFAPNQLLPDVVTIATDHDIRNPAGLVAVERITSAIMAIPGVRMVQSASRPDGTVPQEATLTAQAGTIGDRLDDALQQLNSRQATFNDLDASLGQMSTALDGFRSGLHRGAAGLGEVTSAAARMHDAMTRLAGTIDDVSQNLDPLRSFTTQIPNCSTNPLCADVQGMVQWADIVVESSTQLTNSAGQLATASATSEAGLAELPNVLNSLAVELQRARTATASLKQLVDGVSSPIRQLSGYLHDLADAFQGSPGTGYYVSSKAMTDPLMREVLDEFISPNGRATVLLVYGEGHEWGSEGAQRVREIKSAIRESTKEGTFKPTDVELAGVGPATHDLQVLERGDVTLLAAAVLIVVFAIVALLLRSPVAGFVVVGTVVISYAAALGASALIWQQLLGHELHWAVPPIAFGALVAVGSDYNLLLALRIREERCAGLRISIVRAFAATGGVVTTAGLVFGITMFALASSSVLSVAQIGTTIGVGLVLDTLVVRSFILPSLIALLGRWFWWPRCIVPGSAEVPDISVASAVSGLVKGATR